MPRNKARRFALQLVATGLFSFVLLYAGHFAGPAQQASLVPAARVKKKGAKHGGFASVALPPSFDAQLCEAFGAQRCRELKAMGLWPPLEVDFDLRTQRTVGRWNRSAEQLFGYEVPRRAPALGLRALTVTHLPRVEYFPAFFTHAEADRLRALAEPHLMPSGIGAGKGVKPGAKLGRTSDGVRLDRGDPFVKALERRVTDATGFSGALAERLYVLRYKEGQLYHKHLDSNADVPRAATFFAWLEDLAPPASGGWTSWPLSNKNAATFRPVECVTGLRARPVKGAAVVFYDMFPDGTVDRHSLHAGCPPVDGVKWAVTKWLQIKKKVR